MTQGQTQEASKGQKAADPVPPAAAPEKVETPKAEAKKAVAVESEQSVESMFAALRKKLRVLEATEEQPNPKSDLTQAVSNIEASEKWYAAYVSKTNS